MSGLALTSKSVPPDDFSGRPSYMIRFPDPGVRLEQDAEYCEVMLDGDWKRIRLHDYDLIYNLPGLYEQLFYDELKCDSPRKVVGLLGEALADRSIAPEEVSVIDVGAGNGMVAEQLRSQGMARIVGVDIIPEARDAAERDRPEAYYLVLDLTHLDGPNRNRLTKYRPNCLITVAALGFGDIPPEPFANAFNAIDTSGWLAFNIRDSFLNRDDRSGFSRLIQAMIDQGIIQIEASRRYCHRMDIRGNPIEYVAFVCRKMAPLPDPLVREFSTMRELKAKPSEALICFQGVSKQHEGAARPAVDNLSLDIRRNELLVIVGGSGAGKTTALKMINRLQDPTHGHIAIDGVDTLLLEPVGLRREVGYVFQGVGLFPHLTIAENVAVVPRLLGWGAAEVAKRVDELLELVGLPPEEYRLRRPPELSGGQQQRVGFARALAARPRIMLLDEPFGALDPITRAQLQREFNHLHKTLELTSVLVTHDMAEALLLADRIAVMSDGQLVQVGTPVELLASPANGYVADLLATPKAQAERIDQLLEAGEQVTAG